MAICKKCEIAQRGMFSGQAFTDYECAICGKIYSHGNTDIPRICPSCSERMNICQKCLNPLEDRDEK